MKALMVIVVDKSLNLNFEIIWKEVVFEKNTDLKSLVQTPGIALVLGVVRCTTQVLHTFTLQLLSQVARDVAGVVVAQEP